ncbi:AraC family transcriptional regulator [Marinobacter halodurans]|uniref:AraC family transcriptional regulator n=1 Tax=Marinobacter halodurans TaxID=2528979 RepID=A0ABY1ZMR6_9GAMM|nr:AraC family transcriptional regulator [Marinobacter halodurans]TBW57701.1 AraC family transcriptional regulator [Marinobacter halodurans]
MSQKTAAQPIFWRDERMPHVELRCVEDGRQVCYAPHSHAQWSMGAITGGQSTFDYATRLETISEGTLVFMNPEWVHACNPIADQPWAYLMLYVDRDWLAALRHELGLLASSAWVDLQVSASRDPVLYEGYRAMAACLLEPGATLLEKQSRVVSLLSSVMLALAESPSGVAVAGQSPAPPGRLREVAVYIDDHCADEIALEQLCEQAGCTAGHLIRSFRQYFGLTPHAYQINQRIRLGQQALKAGQPIADAALMAGFADQPHFQRVFKRLVAATPRQYVTRSVQQQDQAASRK